MKRGFISMVFALVLCASAGAANDHTFLSYKWQGGFSPYKDITVTIFATGLAEVKTHKQDAETVDYKTQLSEPELGALKSLVKATDFFSQQEQDSDFASDTGETELSITDGDRKKTLIFQYRPPLEPLCQFLWKLVSQAEALHSIESDGDIYSSIGAVNPRHAGPKALQPDRFKNPLMKYIEHSETPQKVGWALEGLAWITTPEEFSGYISIELSKETRREMVLRTIGMNTGNLPDSHLKSLCPIYLTFVRDNCDRRDELTQIEKEAISGFIQLLGETRYQAAIPLFMKWFEAHDQPYITTELVPLAKMGSSSLGALLPQLESTNESHRLNSIELITIASRLNPRSKYSNPLSDYEYQQMIPIFTNSVIPRLGVMSLEDPSQKIREKSAEALIEIESEIRK